MRGLSKKDRTKIEKVKDYLGAYAAAKESNAALKGLDASAYVAKQQARNAAIMRGVENAIGMLPVSRGKTILEKRFICGEAWSKIYLDLQISQTTALTVYRTAILQLYDLLIDLDQI